MGVLGPEEDGRFAEVGLLMQQEGKWVRFWRREKLLPSVHRQAVQCHMTDDQIEAHAGFIFLFCSLFSLQVD